MADDSEAEDEGPVVELGEGEAVSGAPLARVAERFEWAQQKSEIVRREGDTEIRTPEGPRPLVDLLDEVEMDYFATQREFLAAVRAVVGNAPVQTE